MTVIPLFKPHSGHRRNPAAQRSCVSPMGNTHTSPHLRRPLVSPEASGQLGNVLIAAAVFGLVGAVFWWAA